MKALVVGYGSIGRRHINNLSSFPDMEILVCTNQNVDNFLKKRNCKIFGSLDKCIKEKPDIAFITNITSRHVKTAIKLAKVGTSLFVEKPLSNSMVGVKLLLKIIKKKKIITLMGCNLRFHPCIKKIKEIISSGKIGKIISVRVENGSYLPDWHPAERYQNGYAARDDLGGGVILTCIHEIDYLYWFFGKVNEVYAIAGKFSNLDLSTDDLAAILLHFKNDVIAETHLDYFQRPDFRSCKIIGTKGTLYWDSETNVVKMYDIKKQKWITQLSLQNYDNNKMYLDEISYFLSCLNKKQETFNSIEEGAKTLEIALAIKRSSKIKRPVKLN